MNRLLLATTIVAVLGAGAFYLLKDPAPPAVAAAPGDVATGQGADAPVTAEAAGDVETAAGLAAAGVKQAVTDAVSTLRAVASGTADVTAVTGGDVAAAPAPAPVQMDPIPQDPAPVDPKVAAAAAGGDAVLAALAGAGDLVRTALAELDPKMLTVEGFDFDKLTGEIQGSALSDGRKAALVQALDSARHTPEALKAALDEIRTAVQG